MELQNKFEKIIGDNTEVSTAGNIIADKSAKECTKLCLEEQIKVLNSILSYCQGATEDMIYDYSKEYKQELQQQLKDIENK